MKLKEKKKKKKKTRMEKRGKNTHFSTQNHVRTVGDILQICSLYNMKRGFRWCLRVMTVLINSVLACQIEPSKTPSSLPIICEDTTDFFYGNILTKSVYLSVICKSYPEWCENHVHRTNRSQNQVTRFPQFPPHAT